MNLRETNTPATGLTIDQLLDAAVLTAVIWLAYSLFVHLRRKAMNLTPVDDARVNEGAKPDFLKVDHAGRAAALERGAAFDRELDQRARARAAADAGAAPAVRRVTGWAALGMSLFSLGTLLAGSVWQVSWVSRLFQEYSQEGRLMQVVRANPLAVAVSGLVVAFHLYRFVLQRRWETAQS